MKGLQRFSISIEEDLLKLLDAQVKDKRYPTRSDAVRALIRRQATHQSAEIRGEVIGHIALVYDHHQRNLVSKILHAQHDTPAAVLGAQHFHLDHHHCIESILARGNVKDLEALHKTLQALRGIKHVSFTVLAPAKDLT